ncbi:MAG: DUF4268 domain-containing protein [Alphaproteobacteria bacterium]
MPIYEITATELKRLEETCFHSESIRERQDLQRLLKQDISVLADDLLVVAEEFGHWEDSRRRIDLLCIDADANLVVIEIKRTDDGGHMELQAIRYAAMVSKMSFEELISIYSQYNSSTIDDSQKIILNFLKWGTASEGEFGTETKIILAAANFSKEITTSVMWLNENGLNIRCIRMKPYKTIDGRIMLDVQQIIPLQEAAQYQTQIREKQQSEKKRDAERYDLRFKFWTELLVYAGSLTDLHANRKPGIYSWVGGGIGKSGLGLNYATRGTDSQIDLYIDFKDNSKNLSAFRQLKQNKEQIEQVFGDLLTWEELENSRACRISYGVNGGYRTPQTEWPEIHKKLVDAMIRFEKAIRPYIESLNV